MTTAYLINTSTYLKYMQQMITLKLLQPIISCWYWCHYFSLFTAYLKLQSGHWFRNCPSCDLSVDSRSRVRIRSSHWVLVVSALFSQQVWLFLLSFKPQQWWNGGLFETCLVAVLPDDVSSALTLLLSWNSVFCLH